MRMDGFEVLDSAIKIGLGAAISALASFLAIKQGQKHDLHRERFRRRLDQIEKIGAVVSELFMGMLFFSSVTATLAELKKSGEEPNFIHRKMAEELQAHLLKIFALTKELASAQAVLLMLGMNRAASLLNEMLRIQLSFSPAFDDLKVGNVTKFREVYRATLSAFEAKHAEFFKEMGKEYSGLK